MKGTELIVKSVHYLIMIMICLMGITTWYNSTVYMNINQTTVNIDKYMNAIAAYAQKNNGFNDIPGTTFEGFKTEMKMAYGIEDNIVSESYHPMGIVKKGEECVVSIIPKVPRFLGMFDKSPIPYKILPPRTVRFKSHHFVRDVNI